MKGKHLIFISFIFISVLTAGLVSCNPRTPSKRRVEWLLSQIPDHTWADSIDPKAFTPEFYELIKAGFENTHNQQVMGYHFGDFMFFWYRGSDSDPEEELYIKKILSYTDGEATARIVYKAFGKEYEHAMMMVRQHGRWVISDWDNMKTTIIMNGLR